MFQGFRIFPRKEEAMSKVLPYGLAILCTGLLLWSTGSGRVSVIETTRIVKQVEVKEVIKYVEVAKTDNRKVEITKPDGTRIVSVHERTMGRTESTKELSKVDTTIKEETRKEYNSARYNLGVFVDADKRLGFSAGIRLGNLPVSLQLYTVPTNMYGAIGLQLEF
jgi:hypothetical protein